MPVASSYVCENCGIKITVEEGAPCPGCGQIAANSAGSETNSDSGAGKSSNFSSGRSESVLNKNTFDTNWSAQHFNECEKLFDAIEPWSEQKDIIEQVIFKTKEKLKTAPNKESEYRLYSYVSVIYRMNDSYKEAYEAALLGNQSTAKFFIEQSQYSILDSLFQLGMYEDFEVWLERVSQTNHPDAGWHRIRYLSEINKFDEALNASEQYYGSNSEQLNSSRAHILLAAGRLDEAESSFRKLIASGPKNEFHASWTNTLAFGILMPQKRFYEAEKVLVSAICTKSEYERINVFSNLASVALSLKEFKAAKRYANKATTHQANAIASESRLTLCDIEYQRLLEIESHSQAEWKSLFDMVQDGLEKTDFDDAAKFLELLIITSEEANQKAEIFVIIEREFSKLKIQRDWVRNDKVRTRLESLRINLLSEHYLKESMYLELDALFISAVAEIPDQKFFTLLEYLQTPFAGIDLRRMTLKNTNVEFLSEWAKFEEQSEILYGLAKSQEEPILVALAENPASTDLICELISKKNDIDLDFALCSRPNLSNHMATILAKSSFDAVRRLIAMRDDLSEETFTGLATDEAMLVRDAIRENQSCPAEIRALAALGSL
jgi:tetratricopeptide (TPR) repeat protein